MSHLRYCVKKQLIKPPKHVVEGLQYEVIVGSVSYGVSNVGSDLDIYGFSIPSKETVFPHLSGEIPGFGNQTQRFGQYQQHHVKGQEKEYDFSIYNIVKYFQLCMENNPNMIDSLFVPRRCVTYTTQIGEHVRENRKLFLHKGAWHKFKGYSYSQLHKMRNKNPEPGSKRYDDIMRLGYDSKYGYHLVRLLNEVEQILVEGDLDLERNREQLKSIRRGEWSFEKIVNYFETKEKSLEELYTKSTLQHKPDEGKIKQLLLDCLEVYYGSIENCAKEVNVSSLLNDLDALVSKYKGE